MFDLSFTMNNNAIKNVSNSSTSLKNLKYHLLVHLGRTANIKHKAFILKKSFMRHECCNAPRLFTKRCLMKNKFQVKFA